MSEQDRIDRLLAEALASPVPDLSPDFERRLTERLRPRRVSGSGRLWLTAYGACACGLSIWAMRHTGIEWGLVAAAVLGPALVAAMAVHGWRRPARS